MSSATSLYAMTPTEEEARLAREAARRLATLRESGPTDAGICFYEDPLFANPIVLPPAALRVLEDALAGMARGHAVVLLPVRKELTTQRAADLLGVSRPFLIGLLEEGKIPFRNVGSHRRVRLDDLMAYKRRDDEARRRVAEQLTADAQELGMGY